MIERINRCDCFKDFSDICALKIKALQKAYGCAYPFCSFYAQINDWGDITAIISRFYSSATISVSHSADLSEIFGFFRVISPSEILATKEFARFFDGKSLAVFSVCCDCKGNEESDEILDFNLMREVHRLFSQGDKDLNVGKFEDWYADVNHRLRHNAASVFYGEKSSAVLLKDGENALLNGIATEKTERSKGEGSKLINKIINNVNANKIYALCSRDVLPFYLKNGFEIIGEYSIINL